MAGKGNGVRNVEAGYESLAEAIVIQAARDYLGALKGRSRRYEASINNTIDECERFFHSRLCAQLTEADGGYLIRKIKEEIWR